MHPDDFLDWLDGERERQAERQAEVQTSIKDDTKERIRRHQERQAQARTEEATPLPRCPECLQPVYMAGELRMCACTGR
jgi:hypothetical protein